MDKRVNVTILRNARVLGLGFVVEGREMSVTQDMSAYLVKLGLVDSPTPAEPAPEPQRAKRRAKRSKKSLVGVADEVGGSLVGDDPPLK